MGTIARLKRQIVTQLLEEEDFILMLVHPQIPGVVLPDDLMKSTQPVGINIGWRMAIPAPDLTLGEDKVSCTLSFNQTPFFCEFPWPAIMQVSASDEHMIWIEPPPEPTAESPEEPEESKPSSGERPKLKLV